MSNDIRIESLPADIQELKGAFSQHIVRAEQDVRVFEQRQLCGVQEEAVIYCLQHAIDLSKGCLVSVDAELPDSLATLSRAILEALFWARYVTLSEEKAQRFADSTVDELKRVARSNVKEGLASITDEGSHEDKSDEFLNSPIMKGIPRRISIESVAVAGGLGHVYRIVYGFASMIAHGKAFGLETALNSKEGLFASLSMAVGALQCIELITADWVKYRKNTSQELLQRLLGV